MVIECQCVIIELCSFTITTELSNAEIFTITIMLSNAEIFTGSTKLSNPEIYLSLYLFPSP